MNNGQSIKPIETVYNGYRFRSRLEARWAVFFDACNLPYEYEKEGYELKDGTRYLPDFYLPTFDLYIEIKPKLPNMNNNKQVDEWERKCSDFRDSTGLAIFLVYGDPCENIWGKFFGWECDDGGGGSCDKYGKFVDVGLYEKAQVVLLVDGYEKDETVATKSDMAHNSNVINASMMCDYHWNAAQGLLLNPLYWLYDEKGGDDFTRARTKARQARFEHGEKPIF